jgi:hypothetical protein
MELTNDFRVGVSVPEAWKVLTDVERIAPLLPGAQLQEVDGDEYRGIVKVKVGPITAQYKGQATFVERDEAAGRVALKASGRETRGQGNASAIITATMTPDGDGTKVSVITDLTITGKVAQFGRGVLADVSAKLIGQFVDALEADLARSGTSGAVGSGSGRAAGSGSGGAGGSGSGGPAGSGSGGGGQAAGPEDVARATNGSGPEVASSSPRAGNGSATTSGPRRIDSPAAEPVDLLAVAGGSTMKRLAPIAGLVVVLVVVRARRRARRTRKDALHLARLTANLPSVADIAGSLPSVADIAGSLPSVADIAGSLPSVADIAGSLPSVADIAGHLPDVRMPEVRVADVRAAIRRGRRGRLGR